LAREGGWLSGYAPATFNTPSSPGQKIFLLLISVRGCGDSKTTVRPKVLCQGKTPMTQTGIEPATCLFVV